MAPANNRRPTRYQIKSSLMEITGVAKRPTGKDTKEKKIYSTPGVLEKINLADVRDGWYVTLTDGRRVVASISTEQGISWLPKGRVENGFLYPDVEVIVEVAIDEDRALIVSTVSGNLDSLSPGDIVFDNPHGDNIEITSNNINLSGESVTVNNKPVTIGQRLIGSSANKEYIIPENVKVIRVSYSCLAAENMRVTMLVNNGAKTIKSVINNTSVDDNLIGVSGGGQTIGDGVISLSPRTLGRFTVTRVDDNGDMFEDSVLITGPELSPGDRLMISINGCMDTPGLWIYGLIGGEDE